MRSRDWYSGNVRLIGLVYFLACFQCLPFSLCFCWDFYSIALSWALLSLENLGLGPFLGLFSILSSFFDSFHWHFLFLGVACIFWNVPLPTPLSPLVDIAHIMVVNGIESCSINFLEQHWMFKSQHHLKNSPNRKVLNLCDDWRTSPIERKGRKTQSSKLLWKKFIMPSKILKFWCQW